MVFELTIFLPAWEGKFWLSPNFPMGNGLCGLAHPLPTMPLVWLILGNPCRSLGEHAGHFEKKSAACQKKFVSLHFENQHDDGL